MSDLKSLVPFISLTVPGVTGMVRRISFGERNALRKTLAKLNDQRLDLAADMEEFVDEVQGAHPDKPKMLIGDMTSRERARHQKIVDALEIVDADIQAAHLDLGFVSLDATIDGVPVTNGNLPALPPDLAQELIQAILGAGEATGEAAKNSGSAIISGGVDGRETNSSTAGSAAGAGFTEPASVANTQS